MTSTDDRKSEAEDPELISDPIEKAKREAENALRQFQWGMDEAERWIEARRPSLKVSMILQLHRLALDGISLYAGNFRPAGVKIRGSGHEPISSGDVPRYIEEMFEYLIDNWDRRTALHLAAYSMWRLNWIHPFSDGNGRTSRIFSYMVLCAKCDAILAGTNTIPEQISNNKKPYYDALEKADVAYSSGKIDVTDMELLLEDYLANQLVDIQERATGKPLISVDDIKYNPKFVIIDWIERHPAMTGLIGLLLTTLLVITFT